MELVNMKEAVEKATEFLKIFRTSDKLVFLSNICLRDQRLLLYTRNSENRFSCDLIPLPEKLSLRNIFLTLFS